MTNSPYQGPEHSGMRLYDEASERLYLNAEERSRFLKVANTQSPHVRAFCLTLYYTGCRLSEARELRFSSIQSDARLISVRSLKKRDKHHIREIPVPAELIDGLSGLSGDSDQHIWQLEGRYVPRITAYRWIKSVMNEANIHGPKAVPKGLRHSYGVHAVRSGIQLHMLQKWMGHASITTTAIYANAVGREEMELADRMWK